MNDGEFSNVDLIYLLDDIEDEESGSPEVKSSRKKNKADSIKKVCYFKDCYNYSQK